MWKIWYLLFIWYIKLLLVGGNWFSCNVILGWRTMKTKAFLRKPVMLIFIVSILPFYWQHSKLVLQCWVWFFFLVICDVIKQSQSTLHPVFNGFWHCHEIQLNPDTWASPSLKHKLKEIWHIWDQSVVLRRFHNASYLLTWQWCYCTCCAMVYLFFFCFVLVNWDRKGAYWK